MRAGTRSLNIIRLIATDFFFDLFFFLFRLNGAKVHKWSAEASQSDARDWRSAGRT